MILSNSQHLSYCTNIHSGESWNELKPVLEQNLPLIKRQLSSHDQFGVGLRLSAQAAAELLQGNNLEDFSQWLQSEQLYVFTMNGFPYGNFHNTKVKDMVHSPDWTTPERLTYTENLIDILAFLIPKGFEAGISTSPISYRPWHTSRKDELEEVYKIACAQFSEVVLKLAEIESTSNKYLHIDIEPEPDGLLENSEDVIDFFKNYLFPIGTERIAEKLQCSANEARELISRHIQVCYDVCHFALVWEEVDEVVKKFEENNIRIGKVQISAAVEARFTDDKEKNLAILNELKQFSESTYLHQVSVKRASGKVDRFEDLPFALQSDKEIGDSVWRIHYHVPVFLEDYSSLNSTQKAIVQLLEYNKKNPVCRHLEVETYTWEVLPEALKESINDSICRELDWVKEQCQ